MVTHVYDSKSILKEVFNKPNKNEDKFYMTFYRLHESNF